MLHIFLHSKFKRAETVTLLDLEAIENFMSLDYTKYLLVQEQQKHQQWLEEQRASTAEGTTLRMTKDGQSFILPSNELKRRIMHLYHNGLSGHLE